MLIAHDVAEAWTGDIVSHWLAPDEREVARLLELRAHRHLKWKLTYGDAPGSLWLAAQCEHFRDGRGATTAAPDSAAVAKELDKLENLIQLCLYRERNSELITDNIFDEFSNSLREKIVILRDISDNFMLWCERNRGKIASRPRLFFNPAFFN